MNALRAKQEEFGSFLLALLYVCLQTFVRATMGSVYWLFGIPKSSRTLRHAEIFLVTTTASLIALIVFAQYWPMLGWFIVVLGNVRILQIIALNLITLVFDFSPIGDSNTAVKRARWHFVAIAFSFLDAALVFAFMFQFFDARWEILNQHSNGFVHYLYYTLVTMGTIGYGDITPVTVFGRILAMYQILVSLFFVVFFVSGAVGRLQKHG